jgi:hypothetical protein
MPDGWQMQSTHICNITIPGLPTILTGHIVLHLAVALLIGIRPLCNAGCTVVFDKDKYDVLLNGKDILQGYKDVSTDFWTLYINGCGDMRTTLPQSAPGIDCVLHASYHTIHPGVNL